MILLEFMAADVNCDGGTIDGEDNHAVESDTRRIRLTIQGDQIVPARTPVLMKLSCRSRIPISSRPISEF
jgi:hypothetical protein